MSTDRLSTLLEEYAQLEKQMEDPSIHSDQALVRRVGRRFAELAPLYAASAELDAARADLAAAKELAAEDPSFAGRSRRSPRCSHPWRRSSARCSSRATRTTPRT